MADTGSFESLLNEYLPMIRSMVSSFPAFHREDLLQEGSLGLSRARDSYNAALGVPFKVYARACIRNQISSAYKVLCRNDAVDRVPENNPSQAANLEDDIIEKKDTEEFFRKLRLNLSEMEAQILSEYLMDKSYEEISEKLNVSLKTVDNSLSRIKAKIKKLY